MSVLEASLNRLNVTIGISDGWKMELNAPHRHYHTLVHIEHILSAYADIGDDPNIIASAWLHDIRYDAARSDNEEMSATVARHDLKGTNADIETVVDIILDTKTHLGRYPIFNDLDLLILGESRDRYTQYMLDIRREYNFVPLSDYTKHRATFMRNFNKSRIFSTEYFSHREKTAHDNLDYEIDLLENNPKFFT